MAEENTGRLELDKILKLLFHLSQKLVIFALNSLFNCNFDPDTVEIIYGNTEFITLKEDDIERIVADLCIVIRDTGQKLTYHIEFQTLNDKTMVFRMFLYGFHKALEQTVIVPGQDIDCSFPSQIVIFLEENSALDDTINCNLNMPDGTVLKYSIPVVRFWEYSCDDLMKHKLYLLLPLRVFNLRKTIRKLSAEESPHKEALLKEQFGDLRDMIIETGKKIKGLYDVGEINGMDLEAMLTTVNNISTYLYEKYDEFKSSKEETETMLTSLIPEKVKQEWLAEGRIEGKKEGEKEGGAHLLIRQLSKKWGTLPESAGKKIKAIKELAIIEKLSEEIFNMDSARDIDYYINVFSNPGSKAKPPARS